MNLHDLYKDEHLLLPKAIPAHQTYRSFIFQVFDDYLMLLNQVRPTVFHIKGLRKPTNFSKIIKIQGKFIQGIKDVIEIYYDGQPSKAYDKFAEVIDYRRATYKNILNISEFDVDENFYRIRKKSENFPYNALEMFHIPFDQRGKVATQRYSIPGFPSLYLAKTLYVAWEELNRPDINNFQAVRLVSKNKIQYLDLTVPDWGEDNLNATAYKYLMTWPLIAACSVKVKEYNDPFKPEYILPQLLLQWVRNTSDIDGIIYHSTHIDNSKLMKKGDLYNLALPVKENKDKGHCNHLMNLFEITETISKQLLEYSTGGMTFLHSEAELQRINNKIPALEIIKGRKSPYSYSVLGNMEMILDGMKTKGLQF